MTVGYILLINEKRFVNLFFKYRDFAAFSFSLFIYSLSLYMHIFFYPLIYAL